MWPCGAAERLKDAYNVALTALEATSEHLFTTSDSAAAELAQIRDANSHAHEAVVHARGRYWRHVEMHGCRKSTRF
jgi:hypothetical protein